jgi:hypothetical protein
VQLKDKLEKGGHKAPGVVKQAVEKVEGATSKVVEEVNLLEALELFFFLRRRRQ